MFVAVLLSGLLRATIVPRMSLEQMVAQSDFIVHGRIGNSWAAWDAARRWIWTHHEVELYEALKSAGPSRIVVSVPGGIADGIGMQVSGTARFTGGQEVLLFLQRAPNGYLRITAWTQGQLRVSRNDPAVEVFKARVRELVRKSAGGR